MSPEPTNLPKLQPQRANRRGRTRLIAVSSTKSKARQLRAVERPTIWVLSGPLLDRLGKREPEIYGHRTLDDIHDGLSEVAATLGYQVDCRQSAHEGQLVQWLVDALDAGARGVLLNPGAYTHTSWALYDAIRASSLPVLEVHLSNPEARETFRRRSRVAAACVGKVAGLGANSYSIALRGLIEHLGQGEDVSEG